jgi:class 3 adenylate cyclase
MNKKDKKYKGGLLGEYILYGVFVGIAVFLLVKSLGAWNVIKLETIVAITFLISVISGVIISGLFSYFLSQRTVKNYVIGMVFDVMKYLQQKNIIPLEYKMEKIQDINLARNKILHFVGLQADRIAELTRQKKEYEDTIARFTDFKGQTMLQVNDTKGEIKDVTILFTDVKNFTEFYRKVKTEDVMKYLNAYLTEVVNIVHKHKGIVNKFIGDGVMAVFESKPGDEKENGHELRALAASLEIMKKFDSIINSVGIILPAPLQVSYGIGIGLHSGPAIVGTVGSKERMEFTVLGDTVEIANRIAMVSRIGAVLISADTYQRIGKKAEVIESEPVNIGGKDGMYKVYIATGINLIIR